jgi:hypothetical protein
MRSVGEVVHDEPARGEVVDDEPHYELRDVPWHPDTQCRRSSWRRATRRAARRAEALGRAASAK